MEVLILIGMGLAVCGIVIIAWDNRAGVIQELNRPIPSAVAAVYSAPVGSDDWTNLGSIDLDSISFGFSPMPMPAANRFEVDQMKAADRSMILEMKISSDYDEDEIDRLFKKSAVRFTPFGDFDSVKGDVSNGVH